MTIDEAGGSRPNKGRRWILAVGTVGVVLLAGGVGGWYFITHQLPGPGPRAESDGPTFYQVLSSLNGTVRNTTGGPWSLVSVIGVASPFPFSPNVAGYLRLNVTVNSCQEAIDGLTLWNGSLPHFTGVYSSGSAPFWQLAYYSNSSQAVLIATSVSGTPHVYAPVSISNNCTYAWTTFRSDPSSWTNQILANSTLPVDSSVAAAVAWSNSDRGWIQQNTPLAEVFALGPGLFTATGDVYGGNWEVYFMGCGVAGYTGVRLDYAAGVSRTGDWGGALNLTRNCVTLNSTGPVIDQGINKFFFSPPGATTVAATSWIDIPYQVGVTALNGSFYGYYDGWGVANWMTKWSLTNSSGSPLQLGSPGCNTWVPVVSDCVTDTSGWYAVVLSATGEWINSYGVQPNGAVGWAEPVTAFASHQQLELVVPSSWNVPGDTLTVASTVSVCAVVGSVTL